MTDKDKITYRKISYALISMGIRPSSQGFTFLLESIVEYGKSSDLSLSDIYRKICVKYSVSDTWRDRSMHRCIINAPKGLIISRVNELAEAELLSDGRALTCNYFVSVMSELVRFEELINFGDPQGLKDHSCWHYSEAA